MQNKRLEMYLGWTCNHKCQFCIEMPTMDVMWDRVITEREVLKKLIKFKQLWYNHVTYLWGEPFIQKNFWFALNVAKKLWYKILVTTNAATIQFDQVASKYLPYIDELIISLPIVDKELQPVINNTKAIIDFDTVFQNIEKYWKGSFLKINTVITPKNLDSLEHIVEFINKYNVKEISFTYPDIYYSYYKEDKIKDHIAAPYEIVKQKIQKPYELCKKYGINVQVVDIPLCQLPENIDFNDTDDYHYQSRTKVHYSEQEYTRVNTWPEFNEKNKKNDQYESLPRMRKLVEECKECKFNSVCWWPSEHYQKLFWLDIIKAIK
jgi:MoaA/NifB/PqqE/SkfB family radical SAM enzyme